ncbi:DUF6684 family protein [Haloplanus salilacus]|uniref:DUF6684 family protein n=1 Tax=Haloplanus salilacus TaxID=2949994 RepID=UPI0030CD53AD
MATKVFDREMFLDLIVNFIPLFLLFFFIVGYTVYNPFGVDTTFRTLQYALIVMPFVLLALLTYLSAKAIGSSESESPAYLPGGSTVDGAEPIEDHEE